MPGTTSITKTRIVQVLGRPGHPLIVSPRKGSSKKSHRVTIPCLWGQREQGWGSPPPEVSWGEGLGGGQEKDFDLLQIKNSRKLKIKPPPKFRGPMGRAGQAPGPPISSPPRPPSNFGGHPRPKGQAGGTQTPRRPLPQGAPASTCRCHLLGAPRSPPIAPKSLHPLFPTSAPPTPCLTWLAL